IGSIIRTGPNEVHVNDPEFYLEYVKACIPGTRENEQFQLYGNEARFPKDPSFYEVMGLSESLGFITNRKKHKYRHHIVKSLFSKASIDGFSPIIEQTLSNVLSKASEAHRSKSSLDIQQLYRCFTADIIMSFLFGKSMDLTTRQNLDNEFLDSMTMFSNRVNIAKQFPILSRIALAIPEDWANTIAPGYVSFRRAIKSIPSDLNFNVIQTQQCAQWIKDVQESHKLGVLQTGVNGGSTLFDLFLQENEEKREQTIPMESLIDEAFSFSFAGNDTTSSALAHATYFILTHPLAEKRLRDELGTVTRAEDQVLPFKSVSNLPFLSAIIQESLRLGTPTPARFPRIVPREGIYIKGQYIPPGTTISVVQRMVHDDPGIFPEPDKFVPDRWLGEKGKQLRRWHVSFSRGSRSCIGIK
ncbi:cytochrome P450, partial [Penicillium frequentans]